MGELALVTGAGDTAPLSAFSAAAALRPIWLSQGQVGVGGDVGEGSRSTKSKKQKGKFERVR